MTSVDTIMVLDSLFEMRMESSIAADTSTQSDLMGFVNDCVNIVMRPDGGEYVDYTDVHQWEMSDDERWIFNEAMLAHYMLGSGQKTSRIMACMIEVLLASRIYRIDADPRRFLDAVVDRLNRIRFAPIVPGHGFAVKGTKHDERFIESAIEYMRSTYHEDGTNVYTDEQLDMVRSLMSESIREETVRDIVTLLFAYLVAFAGDIGPIGDETIGWQLCDPGIVMVDDDLETAAGKISKLFNLG